MTRRTAIGSHRGGALLWPENSPTAFRETAKLPVEFVEFDIHQTRDGAVVVHHDPTLDRTTTGSGPLADHDLAALHAVTLRDTAGERIPTLAEVAAMFTDSPITLRVEIKADVNLRPYPALPQQAAAILVEHRTLDRTVVSSFFIETLLEFREAAAPWGLIWLINPYVLATLGLQRLIGLAQAEDIPELGLRADTITAEHVAACDAAGLRIGVYGAHDEMTIRRMLDLNVCVFTTDDPVLALRLRDEESH